MIAGEWMRTLLPPCGLVLCLASPAIAGDRPGVTDALKAIHPNWPDAQFSIEVGGTTHGDAILGAPVQIEYEAAKSGYLAYLHVSSHGDMALVREPTTAPKASGTESYLAKPPLGTDQLIVLFSSKPLDSFFSGGSSSVDLGSDRAQAAEFVRKLQAAESSGVQLAARRYTFNVATQDGGTEYTTRGIVFRVEGAPGARKSGGSSGPVPSHVEFEFDSDKLTERGKRDLDEFGEALVGHLSDRTVVLEGHTDAVGTDDYNLSLSQRRAEAARQYLIQSFGLSPSRVTAVGKGKLDPVASNESETERSRNRRVDFVFSSPAGGS
jgi:outer membrane protein OmpA-like peptidoglycan-associated protein